MGFRADKLDKQRLIDYIEKEYAQKFCIAGEEWPAEVWNTVWDMARRDYFPNHIRMVVTFTSWSSF